MTVVNTETGEIVEAATVSDLGIERLVHIDERIDAAEGDGLRARWEFGQHMLAARDGAGRLPNGYLRDLRERTGKGHNELALRARFASAYPTEAELSSAQESFASWTQLTRTLKKSKDAEDNQVSEPEPVPAGEFATIVADPPWRYGNTSTRNAAENHYPTMSIEELCDLDVVPSKAAAKSHLYLWTTSSHLPEAFKVMEAWGFEYKTYLVWVKPQIGMGNYFRVSTELCLFGVRGGVRTQSRSLRNHFTADRSKHSAKPLDFMDIVMEASAGPYLELFARCHKDEVLDGACICSKCLHGWTTWGNQAS